MLQTLEKSRSARKGSLLDPEILAPRGGERETEVVPVFLRVGTGSAVPALSDVTPWRRSRRVRRWPPYGSILRRNGRRLSSAERGDARRSAGLRQAAGARKGVYRALKLRPAAEDDRVGLLGTAPVCSRRRGCRPCRSSRADRCSPGHACPNRQSQPEARVQGRSAATCAGSSPKGTSVQLRVPGRNPFIKRECLEAQRRSRLDGVSPEQEGGLRVRAAGG